MSNIDKMTEEQYHLELARMYRSGYEDGKKDEELRARREGETAPQIRSAAEAAQRAPHNRPHQ